MPGGKFGSLVVERDTEDANPGIHPCWHGQDDGTIHCPIMERDAHAQPCFGVPGGDTICPMTKREDCWEAPDGQIHCTNPPKSIKKREDCWEAPDGRKLLPQLPIHNLADKDFRNPLHKSPRREA